VSFVYCLFAKRDIRAHCAYVQSVGIYRICIIFVISVRACVSAGVCVCQCVVIY